MSAVAIQETFELALQHHQAGRLEDSEAICQQVLAAAPNHAHAWHLLGLMALQTGRPDLAVERIRQAIAFAPQNAAMYSNLGGAFRAAGRADEAVAAFQHAVELDPERAQIHSNLGSALFDLGRFDEAILAFSHALRLRPDYPLANNNLGMSLAEQGKLDEAILAYCRALHLSPDYAEAHHNLGAAFVDQGRLDEAVAAYQRALQIKPDWAEACNSLGAALTGQDRLDEAIGAYRRALQLNPGYAEAHNNLGNSLRERGQFEEAMAACREALRLNPAYAEAYNNLGAALARQGQMDEAVAALRRALQLKPNLAPAHYNLANILQEQNRLDEAVTCYRQALEVKPNYPEAITNWGLALNKQARHDEAAALYRRALEFLPRKPEIYNNLGSSLKEQGQLDEALEAYRQSLALDPGNAAVHSNLINTLSFHPDRGFPAITAEQQRCNLKFADPVKPAVARYSNNRNPDRRLRVGYISPDFREHVVGRNLIPLFRHHDRRSVEIFCYSGTFKPDRLTEQFQEFAEHWRSTVGVPDEALAGMIRQDGVDILVDLSQHSAYNRLPVFARQPAPVQVSFAGYPESTGLAAIENRISDGYLEAGAREIGDRRSEIAFAPRGDYPSPLSSLQPAECVFLIDSFWCYDPCGMDVAINEPPAKGNGYVTFGSLNNFCKINERVLRLWARVLRNTKNSRLVLLSGFGSQRQRTIDLLAQDGIEPNRVEFVEPCPPKAYLELYRRLDIALDPFPYGGHTTSLDALWMGVPVVSLVGERAVSRAGYSILYNLGLPELVTFSEEQYVTTVKDLAGNLPWLAELRRTLRPRMEASLLMDAPRFARNIEVAYRAMWRRWCTETGQ